MQLDITAPEWTANDGTVIPTIDLPRDWHSHKYADRFTEYLSILAGQGGGDDILTHPAEISEGCERLGRHVLCWDDRGFVWRDKLGACEDLTAWAEENWPELLADDDDDDDDDGRVEGRCCTDCTMLIANGETPNDWDAEETDKWLAAIGARWDGWHVAIGDEHGFSWHGCDHCGSTLGGDRHDFTAWPIK